MTNIPSEEQIEAAIGEIKSLANLSHNHGDNDDCVMCAFFKEMEKRSLAFVAETGGEKICILDQMTIDLLSQIPILSAMSQNPIFAEAILPGVNMLARSCFMTGLRVGINQEANKKLAEQIGL